MSCNRPDSPPSSPVDATKADPAGQQTNDSPTGAPRRVRRAGGYWRLLVHGVPLKGSRMSGAAHNVYSDPKEAARDAKARGRSRDYPTRDEETVTVLPATEFDELVVGKWLHIEEMGDGVWWINVGGVTLWVTADRDGNPKRVNVYSAGDYAEKVTGCEYAVDDEPT